jgi:hypothetical protein
MDSMILRRVVGVQLLVRPEYSRAGWALLPQKEEGLCLQDRINWKAEISETKDIWHWTEGSICCLYVLEPDGRLRPSFFGDCSQLPHFLQISSARIHSPILEISSSYPCPMKGCSRYFFLGQREEHPEQWCPSFCGHDIQFLHQCCRIALVDVHDAKTLNPRRG